MSAKMVTAGNDTSWKWRSASGILALLLAAGCAAPQGGTPPGAAPAATAAPAAPATPENAGAAPAAPAAPEKAGAARAADVTPEMANSILSNLGVLAVPKGKDGARVKSLLTLQGQPAKNPTEVQVTWDDKGLTIIFDCQDKRGIRAAQRPRDDVMIWMDDTVEVYLDPARRRNQIDSRWVHVLLTPAGVEYDECGPVNYGKNTGDPLNGHLAWNMPGLKTKASKTKDGWRGEFYIPWDAVGGTAPQAGEVWGINLNRGEWPAGVASTKEDEYKPEEGEFQCLYPTLGSFFNSDRWGIIVFLEKPVHEDPGVLKSVLSDLRVQVAPKGTAGATVERFYGVSGNPTKGERTSATARWDDQGLTIVVDCEDKDVLAVPVKRDDMDNLWTSNDTVEVFLDIGNQRDPRSDRWLHIMVGAGGSVADERGPMEWNAPVRSVMFGTMSKTPKGGDLKWDLPGLKTKTSLTKTGWQAEIAMTWEGLGVKAPQPYEVWGYNVARNNWFKGNPIVDCQCLAPTISYFLTIERWGYLMFTEQPLNLPAAPASVAALPAPGKNAPKPGVNLLANGDFSKQLEGWNAPALAPERTQVVKGSADRPQVCVLPVGKGALTSKPFALDIGCKYRLTVDMRAPGGLDGRVYVEGYRWKPGVKPHDGEPKLEELQRVWRSQVLTFSDQLARTLRAQDMSNLPGNWQAASMVFPGPNIPTYDQRTWRQSDFGVVSIDVQWNTSVYHTDEARGQGEVSKVVVERVE